MIQVIGPICRCPATGLTVLLITLILITHTYRKVTK